MIGIGLMRKHLVLYNRIIRGQYLIKGISKMKAEEVKKFFNDKLKSVKIGDKEYYLPKDNQKNFNPEIGFFKARELFKELVDNNLKKGKVTVKKNEPKPSNAPEPIVKKNIIIKKKVVDKPVVKPVVKKLKIKKPEDKSTSVAQEQPIRRIKEAPIRRKKKKVIEEK